MSDLNSKNGVEENNKAVNNTSSNKPKFIKDFCEDMMNNKSEKNNFLDSVFNGDEKSGDLKLKIKNHLESGKTKGKEIKGYNTPIVNKYLGVKEEDIKLSDLKNKLGGEYISLKSKRNTLKTIFKGEYDLSESETNILIDEITNLETIKLNDLISSNKKQKIFLKKVFGKNMPKYEMDNFPLLNSITKKEYNEKLSRITDSNKKQQIKTVFAEFKKGKLIDVNLKILIEFDFLDQNQKKEIIEKLIPTISLKQIKDLKLVGIDEILKLENDLKLKYSDNLEGLSSDEKEKIFNKIKLEDIFIETSSIINESNLLIISEEIGFSKIEKDFEKYEEEVKKNQENEGPQNFEGFKNKLEELKIPGIEDLKEGSVFKIIVKGKDGYLENYFSIKKNENDSKSLSMSLIGTKILEEGKTKINKAGTKTETQKFYEIIDFLTNKTNHNNEVSLKIFSKNNFDKLIKDKDEFEVESDNLEKITKKDLEISATDTQEQIEKKEKLKESISKELIEEYILELDELNNQKDDLEKEKHSIKNNNTLGPDEKKKKLDNIDVKINQLTLLIADKKGELSELEDNPKVEDLVAHKNFKDLVEKIDGIDYEGAKLGLKKGLIIETKKGSYEIIGINKGLTVGNDGETIGESITITSNAGLETLSYEAFFQAFKEQKTKRIKKINSFDEIMQEHSWDKNYKIKDGNLIQKDVEFNGKKEDKTIEYLVSKKGKLIKIENIGNGTVEVIRGELSEGKKDKETKKTINEISLNTSSDILSFNELNKLIKDDEYSPDWKVGKDYTIENIDGLQNDINGSFMSRFWNKTSFKELFLSGTMLISGIEEYFKKGNDIKAAEFALKWAKFLPEEIEADFVTQTEMKSAEAMDKELTALGKIASGKAFRRVLGWIQNKDTPPHKIEAGLMLAAKYGVLYPKSLADYNGTFLWYEALGGKIGDELYEEEKSKAEKSGLPFDEKELLISLLGAQSGGRGHPKRRSKFYKEFKGKIAGGFGEEYGDGYKDAEDKRNIGDVINGGMAEAEDGTLPNALGWAKRAVEKGGTLKEMNEIYFSLIFSGALSNAPGKVLEELKNHWSGEGNGMILTAFASDLGGQKIFNNTVVAISKDIENTEPSKYKGIGDKAQELFNNIDNGTPYSERVKAARDFWGTYGDVLSRTLFMADGDEKDSEFGKTDKLIAFGKDDEHKEYFDYIKKWTPQGSAFKKGFMEDEVGTSGVTGLDNFEIVKQHFTFTASRTFKDPTVVDLIWPKIWGDVVTIKEKIERDPNNAFKYKKYLKTKLREISAGLLSSVGKSLYDSLSESDPAGIYLSSIGIDLSKFQSSRIEDVLSGDDLKTNKMFDDAVKNVIKGDFSGKGSLGSNSVFGITDDIQNAANNIIDDDFEE